MFYNFNESINKEIALYYNERYFNILEIHLPESNSVILERFKKFIDNRGSDEKYIIRLGNESFHRVEQKQFVENLIDEYSNMGYDIILSTSSINKSTYEFHPLTNLHLHWKELEQRRDLSWKTSDSIEAFPQSMYDYNKELVFDKSIKSILSVRKTSNYRKYLFDNVTQDDNSILRYADYTFGKWTETQDDINRSIQFPTWYELLDEYNKSIFAFIYETEHTHDSSLDCQISEKTIKAMLSGNIPIVLGQYKFPKYIEEMGLFIANDDFGFNDSIDFEERLNSFIDVYNNIKTLSFDESKNKWLEYQSKIQKNYDVISNLLFRNWDEESKNIK